MIMQRLARAEEVAYRVFQGRALPPLRIVVFAQGRSGTTLLTDLLDSHPGIQCEGEILGYRRRDPIGFVENQARRAAAPCFGFHVKIQHLTRLNGFADPAAFLHEMHGRGWKIVYLWRRNLAAGAVSSLFAEAAGYYHTRGDRKRPDQQPLSPAPEVFLERMRRRLRKLDAERTALQGLPHDEVVYDDDLVDLDSRQDTMDRLFTGFGLDPAPAGTTLTKSVQGDFWSKLANAADIQEAIRAAGLADHAGLAPVVPGGNAPLHGLHEAANRPPHG